MNSSSMSAAEIRAASSLSLVFFFRMLPLFMLLPVIALAGDQYIGANPELLGIALGIYGLSQALLQIPFGVLSDRFGRKPIITLGLLIFILGSLLAALSDSIYGLIAGRALQGAGAVAAAIMALASDLSSNESRTKVMAMIGMSIGLAFSIAFIAGPLLYTYIGLSGLFYTGAALGMIAIILLWINVPNPKNIIKNQSSINRKDLAYVLTHPGLIRLDLSIFISHMVLMANFVVVPVALRDSVALPSESHWQVYLVVLFASLFIMVPFIIFSERLNKTSLFFSCSIGLFILSQIGLLLFHQQLIMIGFFLILFFGAFNYLEALLPSTVSKLIDADKKGAALGAYSTSQFIGIFIGGAMGGIIYEHWNISGVHLFCLASCLIWLLLIVPQLAQGSLLKNGLEEGAV